MKKNKTKETSEQSAFRRHCQQFLASGIPKPPDFRLPQSPLEIMTSKQMDFLLNWQKAAYKAGLVGCDYPVCYGGGGLTDCQRIANQEMLKNPTYFFPNIVGLAMAGPAIFHHGTEEQKRAFLPRIFSAEEIWCQGFSEPNAGSDLANVQTEVKKTGGHWIVNGQKTWTFLAQFAAWMILLGRHDPFNKHGGMTFFIAPIQSELGKSVQIRPLVKMTGESGFNEVFFSELNIRDDYRVDDIGKGWQVALTTLLHERGAGSLVTPRAGGANAAVTSSQPCAHDLMELAKGCELNGSNAAKDPVLRDCIIQLIIREKGIEQCARRSQVKALTDHDLRLKLKTKLVATELRQAIGALAIELLGAKSTLYIGDANAPQNGRWPLFYLNSYGGTIAAGTSEIQRNILAERILGLPKSK